MIAADFAADRAILEGSVTTLSASSRPSSPITADASCPVADSNRPTLRARNPLNRTFSADGDEVGKAPAFQFYAADFLSGTSEMTAGEVGIYIRLLASSWDKGPLPLDLGRLARMTGVTPKEFNAAWVIVGLKWRIEQDGYVNDRLEEQRAERAAFSAKQAGKASSRWHKPGNTTAMPRHMPDAMPNERTKPERGMASGNALQSSDFDLQTSDQEHTHTARVATNPHSTPTNLVNGAQQRLHGSHAWCSWPARDGLCVPAFLAREFEGKGGKTAGEMRAWYSATVERFDGVAIGEDALTFWRREFSAWIGVASTAAVVQRPGRGERLLAAAQEVIAGQIAHRKGLTHGD